MSNWLTPLDIGGRITLCFAAIHMLCLGIKGRDPSPITWTLLGIGTLTYWSFLLLNFLSEVN